MKLTIKDFYFFLNENIRSIISTLYNFIKSENRIIIKKIDLIIMLLRFDIVIKLKPNIKRKVLKSEMKKNKINFLVETNPLIISLVLTPHFSAIR